MEPGAPSPSLSGLGGLRAGSHVCWIVGEPASYLDWARVLLRDAAALGEKGVLFGPQGSDAVAALAPLACQVADPRVAFLGGGRLDPDAMFSMFREQSALARAEGYERLRVVADMDWLLPAGPTTAEIVAFELLLDRHARELDATIVCAYRRGSFDTGAIAAALCVHPVDVGSDEEPQFRFTASDGGAWRLTGEIDIAVLADFSSALSAAAGVTPCVLDASALDFMDVAAMRVLADTARTADRRIKVVGARAGLRRGWQLAGFDDLAPMVELVG